MTIHTNADAIAAYEALHDAGEGWAVEPRGAHAPSARMSLDDAVREALDEQGARLRDDLSGNGLQVIEHADGSLVGYRDDGDGVWSIVLDDRMDEGEQEAARRIEAEREERVAREMRAEERVRAADPVAAVIAKLRERARTGGWGEWYEVLDWAGVPRCPYVFQTPEARALWCALRAAGVRIDDLSGEPMRFRAPLAPRPVRKGRWVPHE